MITERDFVLNNYFQPCYRDATEKETIKELKLAYDLICENTSQESDKSDSFSINFKNGRYRKVCFENIINCYVNEKYISFIDNEADYPANAEHIQNDEDDYLRFKQWFERKRGN